MRVSRSLVALATIAFAVVAHAQHAPKHEFGIDLVLASVKPSSDDIPSSDLPRAFAITTPFDVRIGFVSQGKMMLETRFGLNYLNVGDTDSEEGGSSLEFTPGLNLLFRLGSGSGMHKQMGAYITIGGSVDISRSSSNGDNTTDTQLGANIGIGTRKAWGDAAFRPELFVTKVFETDNSFGATAIGVRLGISFWH